MIDIHFFNCDTVIVMRLLWVGYFSSLFPYEAQAVIDCMMPTKGVRQSQSQSLSELSARGWRKGEQVKPCGRGLG